MSEDLEKRVLVLEQKMEYLILFTKEGRRYPSFQKMLKELIEISKN